MLRGTLDDFTLPDIFRLLSQTKKTGSLDVQRSAGRGKVYFKEGDVYFAESSISREPLGQKLVHAKALTEGQLRKALDEHATSGQRLGDVLLNQGLVDQEQLENAVRGQLEDAVFDLLRWELGEFSWEPGTEIDPEVWLSVSVENLIMEASRRLDELEVIRRKIPSEDAVLAMAATPPAGAVEINITPDEWRILVLVNGARSVAEIAEAVGLDSFQAMKTLHGMVSAGLIEVPGMAGVADEAGVEELEAAEAEGPEEEAVPDLVAEEEPALEADLGATSDAPVDEDVLGESRAVDSLAEAGDEEAGAEEPSAREAEPETESVESNGYTAEVVDDPFPTPPPAPPEAAEAGPEPDVPVEAFDAPAPGDLVAEAPVDEFASEILSDAPPAPPLAERDLGGPEAISELTADIPVSSAPAGEAPTVDRIAAVRELAGLFSSQTDEDLDLGGYVPPPPRNPEPVQEAAAETEPKPDRRRRVEDDEEITRGLISRLIDGVRGL